MKNPPLVYGIVLLAAAVGLHFLAPRLDRYYVPSAATAEILLAIVALVLLISSALYRKN